MKDSVSFLSAVKRQAEQVCASRHARREIAIGTATIRLAYCASESSRSLDAFPLKEAGPASWSLCAWDGVSAGRLPPPRPWGDTAHEPLGIVKQFTNVRQRCAYDLHTQSLIVADLEARSAFIWYPDIAALPTWAHASPFRIPISWALAEQKLQMVHGAAVAHGGGAALLCGAGGSGKSTTALAAALGGFGYLGDDYCAIDSAGLEVHMVYRTAKVLPSTLRLLPGLRTWIVNADRMNEEKGIIFLGPEHVKLVTSAPLKCLLLPRLAADGVPRIVAASRADAIHALLPSTIGGLMGGTASTPGHILRLASRLPAFHLELGPDMDRVLELIGTTLEGRP